jgi:phosphate transport system permease protein
VTALFLSEYASPRLRRVLKPALEVLAGIPTVVYGFFALMVLTPSLRWLYEGIDFYNALSAGLAVGIMILPIVTSLSEDAMRAVPRSLREAGYALGGTKFDVSVKVVVPAALSGIVAAFLLAIARAVGETMIVALAAGALPVNITQDGLAAVADPTRQVQTMTGYVVQIFLGDAEANSVEYQSSYAVAGVLFLMTLAITWLGTWVTKRFREVYA